MVREGRSPKLSDNLNVLLKSAKKQTFLSCIQEGKQNGTGVEHLSLSIVLATNLTSRKVKVLKSKSDKIVFLALNLWVTVTGFVPQSKGHG